MSDPASSGSRLSRLWGSPLLSWGLVCLGLGLLQLAHVPPLANQFELLGRELTAKNLLPLGLLFGISAIPVFGLWRLSGQLGVIRPLAFLFPFFPLATVAFYLVLSVVRRFRR